MACRPVCMTRFCACSRVCVLTCVDAVCVCTHVWVLVGGQGCACIGEQFSLGHR